MFKLICALLLSGSLAYGADTPVAVGYRDFSGGLNNDDASISIAQNESPDLLNVQIDEPMGALTQRNGYISCGVIPGGATATNLYEYAKNDGSRNLIVTDNVSIWQTGDCVNYSTVTTGLSATAFPRFATALDKLWIVNGSTWPLVWDGSTLKKLDGIDGPESFKAKFITYWKSRIWLANTPTAPSSVYFTSLVSSTGAIIAPDVSTQAWSNLNQLYISRDDGSPLYGIRVYRDNLYAFKETGVSRIVFESDYNLSVQKNVTTIGSKFQESIVEMDDGLLRYVGRDGVYAFDGTTVKRLSSKWYPTFKTIKQPSRQELYRLWDTASDFISGEISNVSTSVFNNSLSLRIEDFEDLDYTHNPVWFKLSVASVYTSTNAALEYISGVTPGIYTLTNYQNGDLNFDIYPNNGIFQVVLSTDFINLLFGPYGLDIRHSDPTAAVSLNTTLNGKPFENICTVNVSTHMKDYGWWNVNVSKNGGAFTLTISSNNASYSCSGNSARATTPYILFTHTRGIIDNISVIYASTGIYTSGITTATSVIEWRSFETDTTLSGQTITYEVRTGTSVYNTLLNAWKPISPGALVSTTTDNYAQWRANFSTNNNGFTPLLDSASLGWITGDASRSALAAINYQSRYWMTASTSLANDYNDLVMVESKSPLATYTKYNLPISAFTLWNGNLYGAISNTAKIARLDYGSTDDGAAISSYWNSRDEIYDAISYKTINTAILDYSNDPANTGVTVSLSPDMGFSWQDRTVNIAASTLPRNTKKLNYNANTALGFRTKISNNVLGLGFKVYGLHNFGFQTSFFGN